VTDERDQGPALLGAAVAELASRLRHAASYGRGPGHGVWPNRLAAASRCWDRVAAETAHHGFGRLAAALAELGAVLDAAPSGDAALAGRLHALDAGLARMLTRFDAGCDARGFAADPAWSALGAGIRAEAPPAPHTDPPARPGAADDPVALLVDSPFLRGVLHARLAGAGRRVLPLHAPAEAPGLLRSTDPPRLVLCDNEEPTNNLRRLRDLLGTEPFLVLVSAAGGADALSRRAQASGADAVWPEPWSPQDLPRGRSARGAS